MIKASKFLLSIATLAFASMTFASIIGEDDRFALEEIDHDDPENAFLVEGFKNTGVFRSHDPNCRYRGSGFLMDGEVVTARHVICGMVDKGCDTTGFRLSNDDEGWSHGMNVETGHNWQCTQRDWKESEVVRFPVADPIPESALTQVTENELAQIAQSPQLKCYVFGISGDSDRLQASDIKTIVPTVRNGDKGIAHCGDTNHGSSGGPIVCQLSNGEARAIALTSYGSSEEDQNDIVDADCTRETAFEVGNDATFLGVK